MGFLDGVGNYFSTMEQKMQSDARLTQNYARMGVLVFKILNKLERPYLDKVEDYSEVANLLHMSTYNQYVYSLKIRRTMSDEEIRLLQNTLRKEMAGLWDMRLENFNEKYEFEIVGNDIFFRCK